MKAENLILFVGTVTKGQATRRVHLQRLLNCCERNSKVLYESLFYHFYGLTCLTIRILNLIRIRSNLKSDRFFLKKRVRLLLTSHIPTDIKKTKEKGALYATVELLHKLQLKPLISGKHFSESTTLNDCTRQ